MAEKKALLVIDMLNDFVREGAPLQVPRAAEIVPNIVREIEKARKGSYPVLYVCDRHEKEDPEFEVWPPHAVKGTTGAEVIGELSPGPDDYVIAKKSYSGFFETDLAKILGDLDIGVLILTGVCSEICVLYTAADAYMRGYRVEVPEGTTKGLTEEDHRFALKQIRDVLKPAR